MLRGLCVAVALLTACVDDPGPIDAGPDDPASFDVPIGARCQADASLLCGGGFAVCYSGVCREQCHESVPRCAPPTVKAEGDWYGGHVCVCVPE